MFKELLAAWKGQSLLDEVLAESRETLSTTKWMFQNAVKAVVAGDDIEDVKKELDRVDRGVNKHIIAVRHATIEHITVNPNADTTLSLVLFSAAKDIERVGDHCKNIVEVAVARPGSFSSDDNFYTETTTLIEGFFDKIDKAFYDSNEAAASEVINSVHDLHPKLDAYLFDLIEKNEGESGSAVARALVTRYLKRVSGHLGNIATTVVNPLHQVDFRNVEEAVKTPKKSLKD